MCCFTGWLRVFAVKATRSSGLRVSPELQRCVSTTSRAGEAGNGQHHRVRGERGDDFNPITRRKAPEEGGDIHSHSLRATRRARLS
ncbi:uncharacterized [Tachysurus ichikawai]